MSVIGDEPFRTFNCCLVSTSDGTTTVTISQEREDNIETGIELILNYIVVMFNGSNECIHNTFKRQTKE